MGDSNFQQVLPATQAVVPAVAAAVSEIKAIKPGYKTTEFWLTIVFNVASASVLVIPATSMTAKIAGFIVASLTVLGYSVSRGNAKSGS